MEVADNVVVMNHGRVAQLGTPEEVYNEPADAYVADFLGVSNLMDARVEKSGNRQSPCHLRLGDFTLEAQAGQLDATGDVKVAIRPERIHMRPYETDGVNCLPGMVERLVFLGSTTHIYIRLATGSALQALVRNEGDTVPFNQGTPVKVNLPADALRVLPDPGVSASEIRDETLGDQPLDVTSVASG